ncbi:MAG: hypothetical protein ACLGIK_10700 [Gemmatimonadota bacterium]
MSSLQKALAIVAIVFGIATVVAGGRVLAGGDPGYVVYLPLLVFNTVMGVAYMAAGGMIWRDRARGQSAAGAILLLNLLALAFIIYQYRAGSAVAVDSLRTMSFRTVVWLLIFGTLAAMASRARRSA